MAEHSLIDTFVYLNGSTGEAGQNQETSGPPAEKMVACEARQRLPPKTTYNTKI